ncbi:hypothetical protein [Ahniella affigens]|nr:hypothetical protein [Ahniella affigens]
MTSYEQAESDAEARWLSRMGYPSLEVREKAANLDADALIAMGHDEKSPTLIALGIEKQIVDIGQFQVDAKFLELSALASTTGTIYPLIVEARARLDLYRRDPEYGRATNQLKDAAVALRMAAMMGDYKAMQISEQIPLQELTPRFWADVESSAAIQLQRKEFIPIFRLRRSQSAPRPFPKEKVCEGVPAPYAC